MKLDRRFVAIISGALLVLAFTFYVVANTVPSWAKSERGPITVTYGLWKVCVGAGAKPSCANVDCSMLSSARCSKMKVARAFITIACILSALAALCALICVFLSPELGKPLSIVTKILPFATLIAGIIGVAVDIALAFDFFSEQIGLWNKKTVGAAGIMMIVALVLNLFGAIAAIFIQ
ncbi:unnamed protein product [Rotaria sp. Silwood1]|nr:unnamed protein product [Rotaria sp. Silwood1]